MDLNSLTIWCTMFYLTTKTVDGNLGPFIAWSGMSLVFGFMNRDHSKSRISSMISITIQGFKYNFKILIKVALRESNGSEMVLLTNDILIFKV